MKKLKIINYYISVKKYMITFSGDKKYFNVSSRLINQAKALEVFDKFFYSPKIY